ncbi:hypothetical protein TKK_0011959 [Trichogramma kaykai]
MFQCIIQQRNGWIHPINADTKDVFPGNGSALALPDNWPFVIPLILIPILVHLSANGPISPAYNDTISTK